MKKRRGRLRRIVTGLFALCVALLVAGYAIIASLDVQHVAQVARDEVKAATGRDLVVAGPIDLQISLTPSVDLQDVRFANAGWGSRPEMATVRRLEVEVELLPLLTGNIVVRRLVVVEPDILLEIDPGGRANWEFQTAGATAASSDGGAVSAPDVQDFRIEGGRMRLVDAAAGEDLSLDITEAVGTFPSDGGLGGGGSRTLRLEAAYNGNPFTIEGSYGGLPSLLSGAPGPIDMTLTAGGATVTARGTAGDVTGAVSADLAVTAAGDDLSALSPWVGAELPALGPYNLSANLKSGAQNYDFSGLVVKIGGSDLTGNLALTLAGARPALKGSLVSKRLDLADLTGPATAEPETGQEGTGRIFDDTPLPLEALRAVDAEVKLSIEKFSADNLLLDDLQTTVMLGGGDLTADPLTAGLAGGELDGRLGLAASKAAPDLALRLDGKGLDFGELLQRATISDEVGGALDLNIDLRGRGATPHALAAGLDGHVQAVSLDGTVDNDLLRFLSAGLSDITGPLFGSAERTRLECFVARFDIAQGQAKSRALVFDTGAFAVAGRGGIDLDAEQVNLAFDTQTSEPSLASLAVPFHVTGPLGEPRVTPDPVGAAVGAVGNVAETGGNIVGGAVDAVGGLIGTGPLIGQIGSNESLCGQALAAIGRGSSEGAAAPAKQRSVVDDVGDAVKGAGEEIGKGIRNLFGN